MSKNFYLIFITDPLFQSKTFWTPVCVFVASRCELYYHCGIKMKRWLKWTQRGASVLACILARRCARVRWNIRVWPFRCLFLIIFPSRVSRAMHLKTDKGNLLYLGPVDKAISFKTSRSLKMEKPSQGATGGSDERERKWKRGVETEGRWSLEKASLGTGFVRYNLRQLGCISGSSVILEKWTKACAKLLSVCGCVFLAALVANFGFWNIELLWSCCALLCKSQQSVKGGTAVCLAEPFFYFGVVTVLLF